MSAFGSKADLVAVTSTGRERAIQNMEMASKKVERIELSPGGKIIVFPTGNAGVDAQTSEWAIDDEEKK